MLRLYFKYLKEYKRYVILGPIFKIFEAVFELLVPLVIADIINNGINGNLSQDEAYKYILKRGLLLLLFAVVGLLSTIVCQYFAAKCSQGFGTKLRNALFKKINTLSFKELDEFETSSLLTRLNSDINNMQQSVAMLIRLVIRAPFLIIGATILSFMVNIYAGIIFVFASLLLFAVIFIIMLIQVKLNRRQQNSLDNLTSITKENISGNRVVRAFNRQKSEFIRFCDEDISLYNIQKRIGVLNAILNPMVFVITNVAIILVLYASGIKFTNSDLKQGDITSLYSYLLQIQIAVMVVCNLVVVFTKAIASARRINEVFDKEPSIKFGLMNERLNNIPFEFKNVSFKYNQNTPNAITGQTFKIDNGMMVGIIGSTGSGKSTLLALMNRFYDVSEGEILLYGRNIKDYSEEFIRNEVSMVFQHANLFSGSIRDNLKFANKNIEEDEIKSVLINSCAYEFVSKFDKGVDTNLYQGGKNLSGGQRQRLAIARGLAKKSSILILDDSKSALDFKTSKELTGHLRETNKTIIEVSQRASDMMSCDLVIVLDKGFIVGLGKHQELIKNCNVYKEICDSQDVGERYE